MRRPDLYAQYIASGADRALNRSPKGLHHEHHPDLSRPNKSPNSTEGAIPEFAPGDTLRVAVKVMEGERSRVQAFEGVCIARSNRGINSSFTVRKISYGEGVERVFPLYAPTIAEIQVVRRGDVRRAKLYYLRGRRGKSARIAEKAREVEPAAE